MGLALCVVVLNNSALNVAVPALMRDLDADLSTVQWIINSYSIVFAGLLLPAGAWLDRWGRKRATLAGLAVFASASVPAAFVDQAWQLIVLRGALGVAAAFVMPGTLALLLHAFPRGERALAISVWSGIAALGVALGPVLGGFLVETAGWSAVFLLNVPLAVGVATVGVFLVRESRDPDERLPDLLGMVLAMVTVGSAVFAVIELGASSARDGPVGPAALLAVLAGTGFVTHQRRARHPLIERGLLQDERFTGAAVTNMLLFFGLAGSLLVLTQRLQFQLAFDPLAAGLAVGPVALTVVVASLVSPAVAARLGTRTTVTAGMGIVVAGFAGLAAAGADYLLIVVGLAAVGTGFGLATPVATAVLIAAVPHDRAGAGSALNDTMQELGFALGVAVIGATLNAAFVAGVDASSGTTLQAQLESAELLGGAAAGRLADAAGAAFDSAATLALGLAALSAAVGAITAAWLLPTTVSDASESTP